MGVIMIKNSLDLVVLQAKDSHPSDFRVTATAIESANSLVPPLQV